MGDDTDRIRVRLANRRWDTRRVVVTVIGFTVVLLGLVMLLLPGPGVLLVVSGFAILATEFMWAWRAQRFVQAKARRAGRRARRWGSRQT
ncbi:MAG TPA: PGPGW domain-containing protein [Egibacteraceae bacterium]|jgi:uncharacterized protein (TIGR02611 family)|nr:PGPGW domain-containing protein [Egibacteraceae bacterium]